MVLITVVIPTRNRAPLLQQALATVLAQDFDDYEVIVSNNNSADDTTDVVQALASERLRYVRTDRTLPMPDHYEFALSHVQGDYVTYLGDDDALAPHCLRTAAAHLAREPELIPAWSWADYFHPNWFVPSARNTVVLKHYAANSRLLSASRTLQQLFRIGRRLRLPLVTNALVPMALVRHLRERSTSGRFFLQPAPDFTSVAAILASIEQFAWIDQPLKLSGYAAQGIGAGQGHTVTQAAQTFEQEFKVATIYPDLPLHFTTTTNVVAQSLIEAKRQWPIPLGGYELSWPDYFLAVREDLEVQKRNGAAVHDAQHALATALAVQQPLLRWHPRLLFHATQRALRRRARVLIRHVPSATQVEARLRPLAAEETSCGATAGFTDIVTCAEWLGRRSRPRQGTVGAKPSPLG